MMKRLIDILFFALMLACVSCQQAELLVESEVGLKPSGPEFTALVEAFGAGEHDGEGALTKTALTGGNSVVWSAQDQIAVFQGTSTADTYQVDEKCIGTTQGRFGIVAKGESSAGDVFDSNIAIYPYQEGLTVRPTTATEYQIAGLTIPSVQTYTANTFSNGSFLMAAVTDDQTDHTLNFKNLCGVLKLQLKGAAKVKRIELCGNDDEPLSGEVTFSLRSDGSIASWTMSESASKTITLDCGEGVQLNEQTATEIHVVVPPTSFEKGFNIVVTDSEGGVDRLFTTKPNPVRRNYVHTMPVSHVMTETPSMVCQIKGNEMYVRARSFSDEEDFVWHLRKVNQSNNRFFNIMSMYTCPTATADDATSRYWTKWKGSSDDICPILVNGSHIGGNHGHNCVDKLKVTGHGKTNADIGSVWTDSKGKTYVLMYVYDANTLGLVKFDDATMSNGRMTYGNPDVGSVMTHLSGATNTENFSIESREGAQLWKCSNHEALRLYADGVEKNLNEDQIIIAERIEILTEYDVIFIPSMLAYLMENVGYNDPDSQHSEDIADSYFRLSVKYQFNRNGSISQYNTYDIHKTLALSYCGLVQSMTIASDPYIYSPDTIYDSMILHNDTSNSYYLYRNTWRSSDKVPYRYYQFTDETAAKGICLAYDRSYGWGGNDVRMNKIEYAGRYKGESRKMYPVFVGGGELEAGTILEGLASRIPLRKHDDDLTAMGWYWLGDDIILMLDSHKAIDKDILLPSYMDGMQLEILDKTESVECTQVTITDSKLRYVASDYGYLVLRLFR